MMPVILRREAEEDIRNVRESLEEVRAGLGESFVDRVKEVLERLEQWPALYGRVWQDVRAARTRRFRYVIYYREAADHVDVLAVVHGSRHESVWKRRLRD
jgi:toxin ParE1/3/4